MNKILVIASYQYLPYYSGGQKSIAQFLDYLGREKDLTVVGVPGNDAALINSYKFLPWLRERSLRRYADFSLVSKLTSLIKNEKFDAVIWEHPYYTWLAGMIKKRTGVRTILHIHNIEYRRFRSTGKWWWWMLKIYEGWFFRLADEILFVSPEDRAFAIDNWHIDPNKCIEVAFGVEISGYPRDRESCGRTVRKTHGIASEEHVLFFNGLLDYKPNVDAVLTILNEINPRLMQQPQFHYKIIICGKRLPARLNELKGWSDKNILYAGFVEDIDTYFKGADLFLNPVQSGGGIKTKMVEAIAFGTSVITTDMGAAGIHREICGNKLIVVGDDDWDSFVKEILRHCDDHAQTPAAYYDYYYWGSIVKKVK